MAFGGGGGGLYTAGAGGRGAVTGALLRASPVDGTLLPLAYMHCTNALS